MPSGKKHKLFARTVAALPIEIADHIKDNYRLWNDVNQIIDRKNPGLLRATMRDHKPNILASKVQTPFSEYMIEFNSIMMAVMRKAEYEEKRKEDLKKAHAGTLLSALLKE